MATYWPVLFGSRILNASRVDLSGSDDTGVTNFPHGPFIVACTVGYNGKDSAASTYKLQWRVSGGSFADVTSTGKVKWATTNTVLSNDNAVTSAEARCTSQTSSMSWQDGVESVGDNTISLDLGSDSYSELQWGLDCSDAGLTEVLEFQLYNTAQGAIVGTLLATITTKATYPTYGTLSVTEGTSDVSAASGIVRSAPTITLVTPDTGNVSSNGYLEFYATDPDGDPITYEIQVDPSTTFDSGSSFVELLTDSLYDDKKLYDVTIDDDGNVYICTADASGYVIYKYDGSTFTDISPSNTYSWSHYSKYGNIQAAIQYTGLTPATKIWIDTGSGWVDHNNPFSGSFIDNVVVTSTGVIYVSCQSGGLWKYTGSWVQILGGNGSAICFRADGNNVLIGTNSNYIFKYDGTSLIDIKSYIGNTTGQNGDVGGNKAFSVAYYSSSLCNSVKICDDFTNDHDSWRSESLPSALIENVNGVGYDHSTGLLYVAGYSPATLYSYHVVDDVWTQLTLPSGVLNMSYPGMTWNGVVARAGKVVVGYEDDWNPNPVVLDIGPFIYKNSDSSSNFSNLTTPADTSPFNSGDHIAFTPPTPFADDTWYWKVRAKNFDSDFTPWTNSRQFQVSSSGMAVTENFVDTFSASGVVISAIVGSLSVTENTSDSASASGDVIIQGTLTATGPAVSDSFVASGDVIVAGSLAQTESVFDTFSATGFNQTSGTFSTTENFSDAFSSSGNVVISGVLVSTSSEVDTISSAGVVPVLGIMSSSDVVDIFSASGEVVQLETVGTLVSTENFTDSFTASGDVIITGSFEVVELFTDSVSASGDVVVTGIASATETVFDTASGSGNVVISGTFEVSDTNDTFSAAGVVPVVGNLSTTDQYIDTATASGGVIVTGTCAVSEVIVDSVAVSGIVVVAGVQNSIESYIDSFSASGNIPVVGVLAVTTTANDYFNASAGISASGILDATDNTDSITASGVIPIYGTTASTETTQDSVVISGSVVVSGTVSSTDTNDTLTASGSVVVTGTLSSTDNTDTTSSIGSVIVSGTLVSSDAVDIAVFSGGAVSTGTLAAQEQYLDTALASGEVIAITYGSLSAQETTLDTALVSGDVIVLGTLSVSDNPDSVTASGVVVISGDFVASDTNDTAAIYGGTPVVGTLITTDSYTDTFTASGRVFYYPPVTKDEVLHIIFLHKKDKTVHLESREKLISLDRKDKRPYYESN